MNKKLPPTKFLRECFTYSWRTGELRWIHRPEKHFTSARRWRQANTRTAGKLAGYVGQDGYRRVDLLFGRRSNFLAHRIIWKMVYNVKPPPTIDHVDGNLANNRLINLRSATMTEQRWNSRPTKNMGSGYRGVTLDKYGKKWQAKIKIHGFQRQLGVFTTIKEAAAVYAAAARKIHGEFYRRP